HEREGDEGRDGERRPEDAAPGVVGVERGQPRDEAVAQRQLLHEIAAAADADGDHDGGVQRAEREEVAARPCTQHGGAALRGAAARCTSSSARSNSPPNVSLFPAMNPQDEGYSRRPSTPEISTPVSASAPRHSRGSATTGPRKTAIHAGNSKPK